MRHQKEHLIPLEKSKRVVYLEKRGARKNKMMIPMIIFCVLAALCLLYCIGIGLFVSFGTRFFLIWGALAAFFGGIAFVLAHEQWVERMPPWFKIGAVSVFCIGVLAFALVEGMIISRFGAQAQGGADYVIILGAQWKEQGPSDVLKRRLDKAITYLQENPDTLVIVSGGQGANEPISEAQGMYEYLVAAGIASERILQENQSTNTMENLSYSRELLDAGNQRVVLVSNNFHMFRALQIARKQGYENVEGLAADSYLLMVPNNMLRECLGVVKDFLIGNL